MSRYKRDLLNDHAYCNNVAFPSKTSDAPSKKSLTTHGGCVIISCSSGAWDCQSRRSSYELSTLKSSLRVAEASMGCRTGAHNG